MPAQGLRKLARTAVPLDTKSFKSMRKGRRKAAARISHISPAGYPKHELRSRWRAEMRSASTGAGTYEALHERGSRPDIVSGASIGAINRAIIAGNRPEDRIAKLRAFWAR